MPLYCFNTVLLFSVLPNKIFYRASEVPNTTCCGSFSKQLFFKNHLGCWHNTYFILNDVLIKVALQLLWYRSADRSRLRLSAACGLLRLARLKKYCDMINLEQLQRLALTIQVNICTGLLCVTCTN